MQLYVKNQRVLPGNGRLVALSAVTFICTLLLTSCSRATSDFNSDIGLHASGGTADSNSVAEGGSGPTILLTYSEDDLKKNPIGSFMYFVPLISPTRVDIEMDANSNQQTGIISCERKITSESFHVTCEFKLLGKGYHKNIFDPAGTINAETGALKKGESLANVLDYIKLEGEGFGRIDIKGTVDGDTSIVTEVDLIFNGRGHKSPVTVGIYDIKPQGGEYRYENRSNRIVARVNSLTFRKTEKTPRMGIKVASITGAAKSEGLFSGIKGSIANLFIAPTKVTKLGNDTMLAFGCALMKQEPTFTFPKATNIGETKLAAVDSNQD